MSSGKLFQTAGAACEKARSAKARLVRSSVYVVCGQNTAAVHYVAEWYDSVHVSYLQRCCSMCHRML